MESEVNKRLKLISKDDENIEESKKQIKNLFRDIFERVNQFEKEYYKTLITALKAIEESTEKHYDEAIKFYEEGGEISEKKADFWSRKM